jgi:hypothetical protein
MWFGLVDNTIAKEEALSVFSTPIILNSTEEIHHRAHGEHGDKKLKNTILDIGLYQLGTLFSENPIIAMSSLCVLCALCG